MIPGRPYPALRDRAAILRHNGAEIIRGAKVGSYGSISDRIRSNKAADALEVEAIERKLDEIDEMKAHALPILHAEVRAQQASVEAMHSDALELEKLAEELTGANRPTRPPAPGSGAVAGNGTDQTAKQETGDGKTDHVQA